MDGAERMQPSVLFVARTTELLAQSVHCHSCLFVCLRSNQCKMVEPTEETREANACTAFVVALPARQTLVPCGTYSSGRVGAVRVVSLNRSSGRTVFTVMRMRSK